MRKFHQIADESITLARQSSQERPEGAGQRWPARLALEAFLREQPRDVLLVLVTLMYAGDPTAFDKESIANRYKDQLRRETSAEAIVTILATKEDLAERLTKGIDIATKQSFDLDQAANPT